MATLAISNDEIYANIGTVLGIAGDYDDWPARTQDDAERIIRSGRRKMFMAHNWSFLEQYYPIVTSPVAEVTGSCANGVITVTVGSIPSSMAGNYKVAPYDDGGLYDVASQGVGTITLVNTAAANDFDSQTIQLYKYRYELPSNFAAFVDPVGVENWQNNVQLCEYGLLPEFQIRGTLNKTNTLTGAPEIFSVTHDVASETGIFTPYLLVYPLMEDSYTLKCKLRIQPGDSLSEVSSVFHPIFSELLLEAILAQAEIMYGKQPQSHVSLFSDLLPAAIKVDKQMRGRQSILPREMRMNEIDRDRQAIRRAEIDLSDALID